MDWNDHIAKLLLSVFGLGALLLMLLRGFGHALITFIREMRDEWNNPR